MEDTFQEGQEKKEEEQDKRDVKEEDNAIEMSEDFDGKMHDGDREPGWSIFRILESLSASGSAPMLTDIHRQTGFLNVRCLHVHRGG